MKKAAGSDSSARNCGTAGKRRARTSGTTVHAEYTRLDFSMKCPICGTRTRDMMMKDGKAVECLNCLENSLPVWKEV